MSNKTNIGANRGGQWRRTRGQGRDDDDDEDLSLRSLLSSPLVDRVNALPSTPISGPELRSIILEVLAIMDADGFDDDLRNGTH